MMRIDAGIPMPPKGRLRSSKYPIPDMKVGDSIFRAGNGARAKLCSAAWGYCNLNAPTWKFTTRTVTEDGVVGARMWRTA